MSASLPSFAGADWLATEKVQRIFDALEAKGDALRIVGGAVRNALLGRPVGEIDFGTTATPDQVVALASAAGLKTVPTGIEHGTLTIVVDGRGYEVTTLREDIETDGRHAVVRFGRDWTADAERRDFTINALSVDRSGVVHDPVGGYADILARRVRFIGDADIRIAEDRLRILRFFRFSAEYGEGPLDPAGLAAAIRARESLRELSAERVGNEMRRIVVAARAAEIVVAMQDTGILGVVLAGVGYVGVFGRLVRFERMVEAPSATALRLAALACRIEEDVERLTQRLRLTNAERDRILAALAARAAFRPLPDASTARAALYRLRENAWRDGLSLAFAEGSDSAENDAWQVLHSLPDRWSIPRFPLSGRDIVGPGVPPGPAVGAALRAVEAWWIGEDFSPDARALRAKLQQVMASAQ